MSPMREKSKGNIAECITQEFIKSVSSWVKWVIESKRLTWDSVCFPLKWKWWICDQS